MKETLKYEPDYIDELFEIIRSESNKETVAKLFQPPWANTIRKFNEVFEQWGFSISRGDSYYQVIKNNKLVSTLRTVHQFMELLYSVYQQKGNGKQ